MSRAYMISCFDKETRKLKHFEVDENVYNYIRQLESYIKWHNMSNLKDLYSFRFDFDFEENM